MEHVRKPWAGFTEIHRVLKPGGMHFFTVPYREDTVTTARVETSDPENRYLKPRVYHQDPYRREDSLVYTDFGRDLIDLLKPIGFESHLEQILEPVADIQDDRHPVRVFVSVKTGAQQA
jgi:hypothetical protein